MKLYGKELVTRAIEISRHQLMEALRESFARDWGKDRYESSFEKKDGEWWIGETGRHDWFHAERKLTDQEAAVLEALNTLRKYCWGDSST